MAEEYLEEQQNDSEEEVFQYRTITIDPKQKPLRIDKFLMDRLEYVSRHKIQNALRDGGILVDGQEVKPNHKVKPGQVVSILVKKQYTSDIVQPEPMELDIRYEDDDLLILHKPSGLVVHPGIGNRAGTLVNGIAWYLSGENIPVLEGNDPDRAGLVHRLDKDTTGLMVIAKNSYTMMHLAKQFHDHTVKREYNVILWGCPEEKAGTIDGNIGRHPRFRKMRTVFPEGEEGKRAVTHYEVLEDLYYVSLVKCVLETGRTHQIRVHMKYIGHPVFNDTMYGGDRILKGTVFTKYRQFVQNCFDMIPRQALHARTLGFVHPRTKKEMFFDSELPEDMQRVLDKWRNYLNTRKTLD